MLFNTIHFRGKGGSTQATYKLPVEPTITVYRLIYPLYIYYSQYGFAKYVYCVKPFSDMLYGTVLASSILSVKEMPVIKNKGVSYVKVCYGH